MCTNAECGLTMAGLLGDPLIQLMMRSDGVTKEVHADLWQRTHDVLTARYALPLPARAGVTISACVTK